MGSSGGKTEPKTGKTFPSGTRIAFKTNWEIKSAIDRWNTTGKEQYFKAKNASARCEFFMKQVASLTKDNAAQMKQVASLTKENAALREQVEVTAGETTLRRL